jgi:hypothetical protein
VLKQALEKGRLFCFDVPFYDNLRTVFDFNRERGAQQGIEQILEELRSQEPLRTILADWSKREASAGNGGNTAPLSQ